MTTTFYVHNMTNLRRTFLGERPTFEAAEHFARWHAARSGIRVTITQWVEAPRKNGTSTVVRREEVASVVRDPLGRLWTDLTWEGAALV